MNGQMPIASYPNTVWDTLTQQRDSPNDFVEPGAEEYMHLLAEIVAIETDLLVSADEEVIWVSPSGTDGASGTHLSPYKTIAEAIDALSSPKHTILCRPGVYTDKFRITSSDMVPDLRIIGLCGSNHTFISPTDHHPVDIRPGDMGVHSQILQGFTITPPNTWTGVRIDLADQSDVTTTLLDDIVVRKGVGTGNSLQVFHDQNHAHMLELKGCYFEHDIDIAVQVNQDRVEVINSRWESTFSQSSDAVSSLTHFYHCEMPSLSVYGGDAAQYIKALYCHKVSGLLTEADITTNSSFTQVTVAPTS